MLVVDDDASLCALLCRLLGRAGIDVRVACTGLDALNALERLCVEGVILDLGLPDTDGLSLLSEVRRRWSNVPVVVLTGRDGSEHTVAALNAGADDYVLKPFNTDEFLARVQAVLRRAAPSDLLRAADLVLDLRRREVQRGDALIKLTETECRVLALFMAGAGRTVSKEELASVVWGHKFCNNSDTYRAFVRLIRKKLNVPGRGPAIRTVRGEGYTIDA
jgi:DNA-binding response OmpR family regulator